MPLRAALASILFLSAPALAQSASRERALPPASPSAEDVATDCLIETGQLRVALGQARRALAEAQARILELERKAQTAPPAKDER